MRTVEMLRKLRPSALLQLERHPLIRQLVKPGSFTYEQLYTTLDGVSALADNLSEAELYTLETIVRLFASSPFDEPQLLKQAPSDYPGAELRVGLSGLCAAGVIMTIRKTWGENIHALPSDALGPWQQQLLGAPDWEVSESKAELTDSAIGRMDDDLFGLLAYAGKNELTLTQKGAIHKRHTQALQRELQLGDAAPLKRMGIAYAHTDSYTPGTVVVLDAALALKLLASERGALRLQHQRLCSWLALPRQRRNAVLRAAWMVRLWPVEPAVQRAAAALEHAPRGVWLSLPRLAEWLARTAGEPGTVAQAAEVQWLEPLAALGWLELGRHTDRGERLMRIPAEEDMPGETGRWYVQPDFQVVVPPDVPADKRWELERFAERCSTDQVHVYALSKESVRFGCEQGLTAPEIVGGLAANAMFDVPDNVQQAISQWAGSYGKVGFAQVMLLRCADPETALHVKRHPKLAPMLLGQLGERDFIVPHDRYSELQALLDKAGFAPRKYVETPGAIHPEEIAFPSVAGVIGSDEHTSGNTNGAGTFESSLQPFDGCLIYGTDPLTHFELAPDLPQRSDALPDMKEIPAMWWKDYRSYHASTRKDMIRKAIEWRSLLKLRLDGLDRTVAPKRLHEEIGRWSLVALEGGREIRFDGDDWTEMKLLIPGLSEG